MRTRNWIWYVIGALGLFGLLCIGLLAAGGIWVFKRAAPYQTVAATLPAERLAAQQAGLPLDPQDLVRKPAVPDSENAAPLYRQITKRLQGTSIRGPELDSVTAVAKGKATPVDRETTRKLLATYAPEMRLAERAAALPDCNFHRDWKLGLYVSFPEFGSARQIARLFAAQAILQNESGHPKAALHSVAVIAHIGRHIGNDPTEMAMLVQIALEAMADRAWQQIIKTQSDKPDVLRLAAQTDAAFGPLPDLRNAIRGEIVMGHIALNKIRKEQYADTPAIARNQRVNVVFDTYEARYLAYWRRMFDVLNGPPRRPIETYCMLKKVSDAEEAKEKGVKATYEMNAILSSTISESSLKVVHCEALRQLRQTTLALYAYRMRTGQFPATLAELKSPAPLDAFTDQPLHYRRTANGFVLYSVGENLKDDGGDIQPKKTGERTLDIGVAYPQGVSKLACRRLQRFFRPQDGRREAPPRRVF